MLDFLRKNRNETKICSMCEGQKQRPSMEETFNKEMGLKGKVFGHKAGKFKIALADTTAKDEKFVVKDEDKLTRLDYEIIGRAFVNRLYSPYYDRWANNCLESFCENVLRQTGGEYFNEFLMKQKNEKGKETKK